MTPINWRAQFIRNKNITKKKINKKSGFSWAPLSTRALGSQVHFSPHYHAHAAGNQKCQPRHFLINCSNEKQKQPTKEKA